MNDAAVLKADGCELSAELFEFILLDASHILYNLSNVEYPDEGLEKGR